jgi:prepilin-type N-terminal cleavage/methylation domain-containing protein
MTNGRRQNGFTLAEILVAMVVTSIILAAVVAIAYAVGAAKDAGDDTAYKQAQLRYATLRISELIRNCRLVFGQTTEGLGIWRADDNGNGQIDVNEVVFLSRCSSSDCLRFIEFSSASSSGFSDPDTIVPYLFSGAVNPTYINLIPKCSNVQFVTDVSPPWTRSVIIFFDLQENGIVHRYQINATLRAWAGHLLNQAGLLVPTDDDEQ